MFSRVLVANRGEIAVRVIRALHELGIEAVAVYSTADAGALHVSLADQSVCIGPPAAAESYLRIPNVVAAAETTGCEAVHPGYGFLAENPAFVRACEDSGLVFIGPGADVMERMGDKMRAKEAMRAAGVPLVPGTDGVGELDELRSAARDIGFPVLLKASAGGGGKGMRLVGSEDELESAYAAAAAEAEAAFGDGSLYLEKAVSPARHVEIQVLCDEAGNVLTLGERECSIQTAPPEAHRGVSLGSARRADARGDGVLRRARLFRDRLPERRDVRVPARAGRPVSLHRGELPAPGRAPGHRSSSPASTSSASRSGSPPGGRSSSSGRAPRRGHAIEIRINAEDPARGFAPAPGTGRRASGRRSARACASTRRRRTAARSRRTTTR